jgi:predicted amidohydrolase YtcJ
MLTPPIKRMLELGVPVGAGTDATRVASYRLWTVGSSWFSTEDGKKGALAPGQLSDLSVLSNDYFSAPEEQIKAIE